MPSRASYASPRLHWQRRHDDQILGLGQELEMRKRESVSL